MLCLDGIGFKVKRFNPDKIITSENEAHFDVLTTITPTQPIEVSDEEYSPITLEADDEMFTAGRESFYTSPEEKGYNSWDSPPDLGEF